MLTRNHIRSVFLGLGLLLCAPSAMAEEKIELMGDQPAVRHRLELRENRFEAGVAWNFTLNRAMRHNMLFGVKLAYHFLDTLSAGAEIAGGFGFNTGLADELKDSYAAQNEQELWEKREQRMSDILMAGDIRLAWTPMYGRIAVFSKLFVLYDLYIFGGFGMAYTKNKGDEGDFVNLLDSSIVDDVNAANEGFRPGLALGLGMHIFFNNFVSLGVEVKNIMFEDNETGMDQTRGLEADEIENYNSCKSSKNCSPYLINSDDRTFAQHWFMGLNVTFFFPLDPNISR